jgi:hypothetical protein
MVAAELGISVRRQVDIDVASIFLSAVVLAGTNAGPTEQAGVAQCHPMSLQKKILGSQNGK